MSKWLIENKHTVYSAENIANIYFEFSIWFFVSCV